MKRKTLLIATLITTIPLLVASVAAATTWYVAPPPYGSDSNDCTQANLGPTGVGPCLTISHASTLAAAGDTVMVAPGIYNLNDLGGGIVTNVSGTPSAYITYQSQVRWGAVLVQTNNNPDQDPAWTNCGSYVIIDGFDVVGNAFQPSIFSGPHQASREGLAITDYSPNPLCAGKHGDYTIVQHNRIHGFASQTCDDIGGTGVDVNAMNVQVIGNMIYNIGPQSFPFTQSVDGNGNPVIDANTQWKPGCNTTHGIYWKQQYGLAAENVIYGNGGYGIQEYGNSSDITAVNNTIFNNGCGGIYVSNVGTGTPAANNNSFTDNNIVYNATGCQPCEYYDPTQAKYFEGWKYIAWNGYTNFPVCYAPPGTTLDSVVSGYGIHDPQPSSAASCNVYDNNIAYGNGSGNIAIPPGVKNRGNIQSDPLFISNQLDGTGIYMGRPSRAGLRGKGNSSPAIDTGQRTDTNSGPGCVGSPHFGPFPAYDFNGNTRPGDSRKANYDIGAWQSSY